MNTEELKQSDLTRRVIGAFYDVAYELGPGFLESVYLKAIVIRLTELGIVVKAEVSVPVWYHGQRVGDFRADLVIEDVLLLELKAVEKLVPSHEAQLLNYLKATRFEIGLLLNFGSRKPEVKRFILDNERKHRRVRVAAAP